KRLAGTGMVRPRPSRLLSQVKYAAGCPRRRAAALPARLSFAHDVRGGNRQVVAQPFLAGVPSGDGFPAGVRTGWKTDQTWPVFAAIPVNGAEHACPP